MPRHAHSGGVGTLTDTDSVPPSTSNTLPVTQDDASEARYSAQAATSSGVPARPIGVLSRNSLARASSVSTTLSESVSMPPTPIAFDPHLGRELDGHVARHHVQRGLAGAVGDERALRQVRAARGDVDDGLDHRLAALHALPDEALGGDPPGDCPIGDSMGAVATPIVQGAGRRPAMTFPFHCMWTGTKSDATQGNTLRCRVSLMLATLP